MDTPRSNLSSEKSEPKAESESAKRIQHIEYLVEKSQQLLENKVLPAIENKR
jgi:hypothetical protein